MPFDLWRADLRVGWRSAVRRPAFTLLVAGTLALGLGAASAVFTLADAALLRPLPYRDPSRLVFVWQTLPSQHVFEVEATPADLAAWQRARSFAVLAMVSTGSATLTGAAEAERVRAARVTASLLPLLGVVPRSGRAFTSDEDSDQAAPVAILSDGLWRRRYGANRAIVGTAIDVDGVPHTVVGVMPPYAHLPAPLAGSDDLWLPMRMSTAERENDVSHNYTVVGRLASGATAAGAQAEMTAIAAAQAVERPATHRGLGARVVSFTDQASAALRRPILVLLGGVVLLLLIAAANAATLLLARTSERQQELAVRRAIGAGSGRLLSLALAEALSISMFAAAGAIALGHAFLTLLLPLFTDVVPPGIEVGIGLRVTVATAAIAVVLGIGFGALTASQTPAAPLAEALLAGTRSTGSARASRLRQTLVTGQIALAVLLLASAGLLLKSYLRLNAVHPGFDAEGVLTFRIALPDESYPTRDQRAAFVRDLVARLRAAPGVGDAAVNSRMPFGGVRGANGIEIDGRPAAPGELRIADQREITPGYFHLMRIRVLEGRPFTNEDDARGEPVAIVNRAMARRMWGGESPIDRRIRVVAGEQASLWLRIVGVVDDVRHVSLAREAVPEMYRPFAQMSTAAFMVAVTSVAARQKSVEVLVPAVRGVVQAIDRRLPMYDTRTMEDRIAGSVAETRAIAMLLLTTALFAASLAAVAIYGSIWYSVAQRRPEIGVRIALGASAASVFRLVAGRALLLAGIGAVIGCAAARASAPLLGSLLFDTRPTEPSTYIAVAVALAALTLAASIVPARRAMRVDPVTALRA